MVILSSLVPIDKAHWELHLKAAQKDLAEDRKASKLITDMLKEKVLLPDLKHPSDIHDWLEYPEKRTEIEALNG